MSSVGADERQETTLVLNALQHIVLELFDLLCLASILSTEVLDVLPTLRAFGGPFVIL